MKLLLSFLLLLSLTGYGQRRDTVLRFLNEKLELTTEKEAVFFGVSVKVPQGWFLFALYPDTTPLLKAYYEDRQLKVREGPYTVYYPRHRIAQQGRFRNDRQEGVWLYWYENGQMKDSGSFTGGKMTGKWKSWHPNGQLMIACDYEAKNGAAFLPDPAGQRNFEGQPHGNYQTWYADGKPESAGSYVNGLLDGEWKWHHPNGQPSTVEIYKTGILTGLQCFDSLGNATGSFCPIIRPARLKDFGDYQAYIRDQLTWPEEALKKRMEGDVKVSFKVGRDGRLRDLKIQGPWPVLNKAVEDLFSAMTLWDPAVLHNRVVDWEEETVIPFYRDR